MNRQLRRAQEKQDKKQDRAKDARRADRQRQVARLRAQREQRREAIVAAREKEKAGGGAKGGASAGGSGSGSNPGTPKEGGRAGARDPGRFAGALAVATTVFIVLQGAMPQPIESTLDSVVKAAFYLMFGYFVTLWLYRRNNASAPLVTIVAGVLLAAGSVLGAILRNAPLDTLSLLLTLPLLLAGVWLGRLIARHPLT